MKKRKELKLGGGGRGLEHDLHCPKRDMQGHKHIFYTGEKGVQMLSCPGRGSNGRGTL